MSSTRWRRSTRVFVGLAVLTFVAAVVAAAAFFTMGGGEPPFHIQQHPRQVGVRGNRFVTSGPLFVPAWRCHPPRESSRF